MTTPQTVQRISQGTELDRERLLYDIMKGCSNWLSGKLRYALPEYQVTEQFEHSATGYMLTLIVVRRTGESSG
jgi:hypothetical protein